MTFKQALIKPLVFGGIDGLTTTLALVWGSIAAGEQVVSAQAVLILGIANLTATALSMGIGDYVGTIAEYESQLSATMNVDYPLPQPTTQQDDFAKSKKLTRHDVRQVAIRSGVTMFSSFVLFGGMPLIPYIPFWVGKTTDLSSDEISRINYWRRVVSTALCALSFFVLGFARSKLEGSHHCGSAMRLSVNMLLMGTAAAMMSFCSSKGIFWLLGVDEAEAIR